MKKVKYRPYITRLGYQIPIYEDYYLCILWVQSLNEPQNHLNNFQNHISYFNIDLNKKVAVLKDDMLNAYGVVALREAEGQPWIMPAPALCFDLVECYNELARSEFRGDRDDLLLKKIYNIVLGLPEQELLLTPVPRINLKIEEWFQE
jgi:hypothetical protein